MENDKTPPKNVLEMYFWLENYNNIVEDRHMYVYRTW